MKSEISHECTIPDLSPGPQTSFPVHFKNSVLVEAPSLHYSGRKFGVILKFSLESASWVCDSVMQSHRAPHSENSVLGLLFCLPCIEFLKCFSTGTASFYLPWATQMMLLSWPSLSMLYNQLSMYPLVFLVWVKLIASSLVFLPQVLSPFSLFSTSDPVCVCLLYVRLYLSTV